MSEPWSTEKIREGFIYDGGESAYYDPINGEKENRRIAGAIFDRWLAEHDRQVAERAWDHCLDEIEKYEINTRQAREGNPYRAKGEQ